MIIKFIILGLMCIAAFFVINNVLNLLLFNNFSMVPYLEKIAAFKL